MKLYIVRKLFSERKVCRRRVYTCGKRIIVNRLVIHVSFVSIYIKTTFKYVRYSRRPTEFTSDNILSDSRVIYFYFLCNKTVIVYKMVTKNMLATIRVFCIVYLNVERV